MELIETERLRFRQFTLDDYQFIVELLNTEGWIKYIGDRNVKTKEQAIEYLKKGPMKSYSINGFGLGLVELKDSQTPIGMSGLIRRDYLDHPDIGFALLPKYSGKGYAYEIASSILDHAYRKQAFKTILAITLPENVPSINLIRKLGFAYERNFFTIDTNEELSLYSCHNKFIGD